jgi:uncharacterized protein (DUF1330 family)
MPAFVVFETNITDPEVLNEYRAKAGPLIEKHGGKYIARSMPPRKLEGAREVSQAAVILEFPSEEHVNAWYNDPEYAPLIKLRQSGSKSQATLIAGI